MATLGAAALVILAAVAAWTLTAFALGWRNDARCWMTILLPVVLTAVAISVYMGAWTSDPRLTTGWRALFIVVSVFGGSFSILVTPFIWLLMETRFGHRAP